jgi:hypothetical protein
LQLGEPIAINFNVATVVQTKKPELKLPERV